MNLLPWFPAVTSTALLALALWLGRQLIATRLAKGVEHEFNKRLEAVRAEMRAGEERLKAELREKEAEISALRSGALSVLASRQAALDRRRLEAVDQLWSAFTALAPARTISAQMALVKFESAAREAERNPAAREVFAALGGGFDSKNLDLSGAAKARPFVSPMIWAVFSAIQAVTMHAVLRWQVLKGGLSIGDIADHDLIKKLILAVLPHYGDYLEKTGPTGYHYALEALDNRLLEEIQKMLSGSELDKVSLEQSAEILRQANALQAQAGQAKSAD